MTTAQLADATGYVARPGKLMRIISVAKAMLEEARTTPCDAPGCEKFKNIYEQTIAELRGVVSEELHTELTHLAVRFDDPAPSPSALRAAPAAWRGTANAPVPPAWGGTIESAGLPLHDPHRRQSDARLPRLPRIALRNRKNKVQPLGHLAEDGVLPVQMRRRVEGDEELAAARVRARVGHGKNAGAIVLPVVELVGDGVPWAAGACPGRVAALLQ